MWKKRGKRGERGDRLQRVGEWGVARLVQRSSDGVGDLLLIELLVMRARKSPDIEVLPDGKGADQREHAIVRLENGRHAGFHRPDKKVDKESVGFQRRSVDDLAMARRVELIEEIRRREGAERRDPFRRRPI